MPVVLTEEERRKYFELTAEERQRIYTEERARIETRELWEPEKGVTERNLLYVLAILVLVVLGGLVVLAYLSLALVISAPGAGSQVLGRVISVDKAKTVILLGFSMGPRVATCILAGLLGGSLSALLSAADRLANGLESWQGKKHPDIKPPDKFSIRMAPSFLIRPLLGGSMGFVVYVGIVGGFLIATQGQKPESFSLEGLAFFGTLAGLFAKTFLGKLKDMLKALVGVTE